MKFSPPRVAISFGVWNCVAVMEVTLNEIIMGLEYLRYRNASAEERFYSLCASLNQLEFSLRSAQKKRSKTDGTTTVRDTRKGKLR